MKRLKARAEAELVVKKSRFIAIALPLTKLEDVKEKVAQIRGEHPSATHVVHAAVVGKNGTLYSSSDDREPKNTAARPALEVLKGSGITDIIICIVRYFGGTLLGTGGLVKAYGDSAKEVLKVVECEEIIERIHFSILTGYDFYDHLKRELSPFDIANLSEDFAEAVRINGDLALSQKDAFTEVFNSVTMGRSRLSFTE